MMSAIISYFCNASEYYLLKWITSIISHESLWNSTTALNMLIKREDKIRLNHWETQFCGNEIKAPWFTLGIRHTTEAITWSINHHNHLQNTSHHCCCMHYCNTVHYIKNSISNIMQCLQAVTWPRILAAISTNVHKNANSWYRE